MLRHRGIVLSDIDEFLKEGSKSLPEVRLNLFVQYKRPEYVLGTRGAEWGSWQQPYFRYGITQHQQVALDGVYRASNGRAEVVYAAPVFIDSDTLFRHYGSGSIIANSNIAPVYRLSGHSRYTYVSASGGGKVHSDAEEASGASLQEILESAQEQDAVGFYSHVLQTALSMVASVAGDEQGQRVLALARREFFSAAGVSEGQVEENGFVYALCTIFAFLDAFNTSIYMLTDEELDE